ncbi:MAG: hypothetical protein ACK4SO_03465 [Candidatus Kapaibacteriota bacterium]
MKFYAFSLLLFFLFSDVLECQSYEKFYLSIDDKVRAIYVVKLRDYEYFYFENLSRNRTNFIDDSRSFTYTFGETSLSFLPGSIFFAINHTSFGKQEFQMNRPAILYKDKLLIPFVSFFNCLSNSGVFASSVSAKSFAFKYKEPKKQENLPPPNEMKTNEKEFVQRDTSSIPKGVQAIVDSQNRSLPRLVLTNNERFNLEPRVERQSTIDTKELKIKNKRTDEDTTRKVPPKYYTLPPELKNSPK